MPDNVIELAGATKSFGSQTALDGLDLSVTQGEVHAFLGPNGAGKTTTLRILLGLTRLDGGVARLFGADPRNGVIALHRRLAYVPGDVALWPNLTGGEVLDLLAHLRHDVVAEPHRARLLEAFALDPTRKCRTYSKGNRQKVALVAALASRAELLVLDEPTSGLDPVMEAVFQGFVREARDNGRTVLLSSHILSEVEALADRVTIIKEGRTVATGAISTMQGLARTTIEATLSGPVDALDPPPTAVDWELRGTAFRCTAAAHDVPGLIAWLASLGVDALTTAPPRLEDLFLEHYRGDGGRSRARQRR